MNARNERPISVTGEERRLFRLDPFRTKSATNNIGKSTTSSLIRISHADLEVLTQQSELVAAPDELADFEARTFTQWDRASLSALRIAIDRRRKELTR
jgi:hypothetical protein